LNTAWIAVIGTLGGVAVTAVTGLIAARFTVNSQRDQAKAQRNHEARNKIRDERRVAFVAYLSAYQALLGRALEAMENPALKSAATDLSRTGSSTNIVATRCAEQERRDFTMAYEHLLITADRPETIEAAREATARLWDIIRAVGAQESFDVAEETARAPRRMLRQRMREELRL
jgi:uncharacterized membrane-anchored protein YhcB (DUF1043 family)